MKRLCLALMSAMLVAIPATAQMHGPKIIEVPLSLHEGRLFIEVEGPQGMVMDFGLTFGSMTVFSESFAAHLEEGIELTMGGLPVSTDNPYILPDEQLTFDGKTVAGIIGPGAFNQFDALIDVLQYEVEETALDIAAAMRTTRRGTTVLRAMKRAFLGRGR